MESLCFLCGQKSCVKELQRIDQYMYANLQTDHSLFFHKIFFIWGTRTFNDKSNWLAHAACFKKEELLQAYWFRYKMGLL